MLSTRDIKRKIRTVQNVEKICRAMKTVSSVKLRRAQQRIQGACSNGSGYRPGTVAESRETDTEDKAANR